jgi:hypothetical protein
MINILYIVLLIIFIALVLRIYLVVVHDMLLGSTNIASDFCIIATTAVVMAMIVVVFGLSLAMFLGIL